MSEFIEIIVDDNEIKVLLNRLAGKAENFSPLMKKIAGIMLDSVEENFDKEGRPEKWKKLSPATIKQRAKKGYYPGKILQVRGELVSSITSKYDNNSAIVGTNKVYAAIHQFGGQAGKNRKVKIPARPFLNLADKNLEEVKTSVKKYLLTN